MTPNDLLRWRSAMKMSRAAAAKALGMDERTLADLERGTRTIKRHVALACLALWHRLDHSSPPW